MKFSSPRHVVNSNLIKELVGKESVVLVNLVGGLMAAYKTSKLGRRRELY